MRKIVNFNAKWAFSKMACEIPTEMPKKWDFVNIPHSWNAIDGQDGDNDYFRGTAYYAKAFSKMDLPPADQYYLEIKGANSSADVYLNGKKPVLVEMQDDLITTPGICLANTSYLRDFFKTNNVPVYLETSLCEIGDGFVTLKDKDCKTFTLPTDSVILSVGYNPDPLAVKGKHIHVIGDADKVGNLRTVIWGAWTVAMKL